MTNRRSQAAAVAAAAGGGLLTVAFLQAAVAAADTGSDTGFTIGDLTFTDPVALPGVLGGDPTPGWESLSPIFSTTPVMSLGNDLALGLLNFGSQQLTVTDSGGTTLGTVAAHTAVQDLLGIETAQFTVASTDPASGLTDSQAAELPSDGTVYSITKIGGGFYNVYEAVPNAGGTASSSITDTVVTPFGNFNLPTTFDAIAPLDPATPLEALGNTSGDSNLSNNAFTLDGTTFDPGSDGITVAQPISVANFAPLINLEAGALNITGGGPAETQAEQNFEVYNNGTDDGSIQTFLWYSNLLGFNNTEFTVAGVTPNGDATDLPAVGTVYSVTDLGSGYENVYVAAPAAGGTGSSTITDTLVTPFGNFNLPTTFDAASPMDPAAPLGALAATSSAADLSDNAFTIGATTFDPGADGFSTDNTYSLFSIAPLLEITGANALGISFITQSGVEAYDSSGVSLGTVDLGENMSNILGIDTTQFTVSNADAASGLTAAQAAELPTDGTVYSITDLGSGWTNVYEAIPDSDGTAASSITDTLITPFGNVDLSSLFSMFDGVAPLDAGDVVSGLDVGSAADAAAGFDLFDPSAWF